MSGEVIIMVGATIVVVVIYSIFSALFNKAKDLTSKTNHMVEPNVIEQLDVNNKDSYIKGIDYCIDLKEYKDGLKLCGIYYEHNEKDEDIDKRIKYLKSKINIRN